MSDRTLEEFIHACVKYGIIVDTCLFLAFVFGCNNKRTHDLGKILPILNQIINYCLVKQSKIILTPHILAELSNLVVNREKNIDSQDKRNISTLIDKVNGSTEKIITKEDIVKNKATSFLGFADVSIIEAAKQNNYGVLTKDGKLHLELQRAGCQSINILDLAKYNQLLKVYQRV